MDFPMFAPTSKFIVTRTSRGLLGHILVPTDLLIPSFRPDTKFVVFSVDLVLKTSLEWASSSLSPPSPPSPQPLMSIDSTTTAAATTGASPTGPTLANEYPDAMPIPSPLPATELSRGLSSTSAAAAEAIAYSPASVHSMHVRRALLNLQRLCEDHAIGLDDTSSARLSSASSPYSCVYPSPPRSLLGAAKSNCRLVGLHPMHDEKAWFAAAQGIAEHLTEADHDRYRLIAVERCVADPEREAAFMLKAAQMVNKYALVSPSSAAWSSASPSSSTSASTTTRKTHPNSQTWLSPWWLQLHKASAFVSRDTTSNHSGNGADADDAVSSFALEKQQKALMSSVCVGFHGTNRDAALSIATSGFSRSFVGAANGHVYGAGVYFATSASYSLHNQYAAPDPCTGIKCLVVSAILPGLMARGFPHTKVPPELGGISCDSTCDNTSNPSIIVTYNDAQCLPLAICYFLDTFTPLV